MPQRISPTTIDEIIENHIHVWSEIPSFAPLACILEEDREILAKSLSISVPEEGNLISDDEIRSRFLCHALERVKTRIDWEHFLMFKDRETVQAVLEDSFGIIPGIEHDTIPVPYQREAINIIVRCFFGRRGARARSEDIVVFMQLFSRTGPKKKSDQDRIMRYKTVVWLVYLVIDLLTHDRETCTMRLDAVALRLRRLLDHAIAGDIIDEDSRLPGLDGGIWERTLFGWLQGEDRKPFVLKLKRQFNFENKMEHANRFLLADHRRVIFEETMRVFC